MIVMYLFIYCPQKLVLMIIIYVQKKTLQWTPNCHIYFVCATWRHREISSLVRILHQIQCYKGSINIYIYLFPYPFPSFSPSLTVSLPLPFSFSLRIHTHTHTTEGLHFHFSFHALEKEMATHSSVLAWRVPGMGEPGGLPSMGWHRVGHD